MPYQHLIHDPKTEVGYDYIFSARAFNRFRFRNYSAHFDSFEAFRKANNQIRGEIFDEAGQPIMAFLGFYVILEPGPFGDWLLRNI